MSSLRTPMASLVLLASSPVAAADFQNVLLIVADDVGTDKVGAYYDDITGDAGHSESARPVTATIDMLASAGMRFTDAWASPMCSPTRAVLYSGEYSYRNGVGAVLGESNNQTMKLGTAQATFAKLAADSGVRAGLFGKAHVGEGNKTPDAPTTTALNYKEYPIQLGFHTFQGYMDGEVAAYDNWLYTVSKPVTSSSTVYRTTATQVSSVTNTDQITTDALSFIAAQVSAGKRQVTVMTYGMPHATKDANGAWTWVNAAESCGYAASEDEVANFQAATECFDAELQELLQGVPNLETTLVIFVGDNGTEKEVSEGRFDDNRGKSTVYESGIRVPFIVADGAAVKSALENGGSPEAGSYQIEPGVVEGSVASVVDIYATIADYMALSSSTCTVGSTCARDSLSMRSVLEGGAPVRDEVWSETFTRTTTATNCSNNTCYGSGALRFDDLKLIVKVDKGTTCRKFEMYDLATDRWEKTNLWTTLSSSDQTDMITILDDRRGDMSYAWMPTTKCS